MSRLQILALIVVSFTLTVTLTFSTFEAVRVMDGILHGPFPDIAYHREEIETFMNVARPIGYACFAFVVLFILLGLLTRHRWFSFGGTFAVFLSTVGDFTWSMFFLGGLGILRVISLPLSDFNRVVFRLGDIAYLPYWVFIVANMEYMDPHTSHTIRFTEWLPYAALGAGYLVFFLGTFTWLHGKLKKEEIISCGIYKYSRHPQYLGFILWSYGMLLFNVSAGGFWGSTTLHPSFLWVVSTLTIICVAMAEEFTMIRLAGDEYRGYREHTPFMIPLPSVIAKIITAPHRILLRKALPDNLRETLCVFIIYLVIIVSLSYVTYVSGILRYLVLA